MDSQNPNLLLFQSSEAFTVIFKLEGGESITEQVTEKEEKKKESETAKLKCVWNEGLECPIRKAFSRPSERRDIDKYVKPLEEAELMKMFTPIFDKMKDTMHNEFGILHYYCQICPLKPRT